MRPLAALRAQITALNKFAPTQSPVLARVTLDCSAEVLYDLRAAKEARQGVS